MAGLRADMALSRWEQFYRSDITATVFAVVVMGGTFLLFGLKGSRGSA